MKRRWMAAIGVVALVVGLACETGEGSEDILLVVGSTTGLTKASVRFVIDGETTKVGLVKLPWQRRRMRPDFGASVTGNRPANAAANDCLTCFIYSGDNRSSPLAFDGPRPGSVTCIAGF